MPSNQMQICSAFAKERFALQWLPVRSNDIWLIERVGFGGIE